MDIIIRRAEEEDVREIAALEAICFEGEDPWSEGAFHNEIVENHDRTLYLVAEADNVLLICPRDNEKRIRQFVNDAKVKFDGKYN